jgi:hypothetical protein
MLAVFATVLLLATATYAAAPTLVQLEGILDRAITMMGGFIGEGVPFTPGLSDNLLLLQQVLIPPFASQLFEYLHIPPPRPISDPPTHQVGAAFAGRVAYVWGSEPLITRHSAALSANAAAAFKSMPSLIIEACVFEIVTCQVDGIAIPSQVFEAFDLAPPSPPRNFSYSAMLYAKPFPHCFFVTLLSATPTAPLSITGASTKASPTGRSWRRECGFISLQICTCLPAPRRFILDRSAS